MSESNRPANKPVLIYAAETIWDSANTINGPDFEPIERPVAQMLPGGDQAEKDALGTKFAAALEMYEALKAQETYIQHVGECDSCDVESLCETAKMLRDAAADQRRAALSKAEGGV